MKHKLTDLATFGVAVTMALFVQPNLKALPPVKTLAELFGIGLTPSAPAAVTGVQSSNPFLDVFVRGTDDRLYENASADGGFLGWFGVDEGSGQHAVTFTFSEPAAVFDRGLIKLFIRKNIQNEVCDICIPFLVVDAPSIDNRVFENDFDGTNWSGWSEVPGGGLTLAGPAAVVQNGILKLFIRGMDNRVLENDFNGTTWSGWSAVPGVSLTLSAPAPVVYSNVLKPIFDSLKN